MTNEKTYGCDDCRMLRGNYCKLWEIKIKDPHNSHCESFGLVRATAPKQSASTEGERK